MSRILLLGTVLGLSPVALAQNTPAADALPEDFANASNAFGMALWSEIRHTEGNLAVSPASIEMALAMTYGGAAGQTKSQMARVLLIPDDAESFHEGAGRVMAAWNNPDRDVYELRVANRLFGEQTYELKEPFLALTRDVYRAPMELVDFRNDWEMQRLHINEYVAAFTNDHIRDLLPPTSLDTLTRLVLTNAVYLKARWLNPFDPSESRGRPFHVNGASRGVNRRTMHKRASFDYLDDDGVTLVEVPYQGDDLAMTIILPDAVDGLAAVEASLTESRLEAWISGLSQTEILLALPKFTIDPADPIDLKTTLSAMGMPLAFDEQRADFTGMADPPDARERLHISAVFHKAFVAVDEEGTEAAAATAVAMAGGGAPRPVPQVIVDRPFLFLIRDVHSGAILFMGRVVDPQRPRNPRLSPE